MCGIAGIVAWNERTRPSRSQIERMVAEMKHRGPDQTGIEVLDRIGLGFARLSILDLHTSGNQPMTNEDESMWLVFNGEIYNYKELRGQLESVGHRFKSQTDSEVILHLYEEYGESCLDYMQGMFSFAVWDRSKRRLFAARDHFGIKPFYYYKDKDQFVFASEIKSILACGDILPIVNASSLSHYLTFQYVPHAETMFEGIKKLEPGHLLRINEGGKMEIKRYWEPRFEPENRPIETFAEELRSVMKRSVQEHTVSDVPLGSFLSGGIDSTSIAAYLAKEQPLKTFSVGFEGNNNETIFAAATAAQLGTDHYEEVITPEQFLEDTRRAVWHMDEPVADPAAIPTYRVSELASRHVSVVLSGEGADELFGGYGIYREPGSLRPVSWVPERWKPRLHQMIADLPGSFYGKNYLLRGLTPLQKRFIGNARIFNEQDKLELIKLYPGDGSLPELDSTVLTREIYTNNAHLDEVSRMQMVDLQLWLPGDILTVSDKMSMAHSLELRVPFLDKKVYDIARRIPHTHRIAGGTTKHVLREAMAGIVPDSVLKRPKLGFPVPLRDWIHTSMGDAMLEQIEGSGAEEWLDMERTREMLHLHRAGEGDYSRKLWTIYIFALWHSSYIKVHEEALPVRRYDPQIAADA
ncbi:asparagine synthase (glutamine-hydrolyzing) [Paenibacillus sp. GCM10023252]|uniref:asparagine synthase (glutamine-hydrolyzing) n=1 Tax=Paenibacillus sp. GCM10023252 TaxID=3252649 RepID=UPI00361E7B92